jgi:hypothetical protein
MNSDDLKKLLAPQSKECPICRKIISGTAYDIGYHEEHCQAEFMRKELLRDREEQERRNALKKELKKLI